MNEMKLQEFGGKLFGQRISIFGNSVAWFSERLDVNVEHTTVERTMSAEVRYCRKAYTLTASCSLLPTQDLGGLA